jgi:peptidoglycan/LPS O-acetylase OafA/YrhL
MGILRIYLAVCVIAAHSESVLPWASHNGRVAVQIFFIISGFYMQLILSGGKYKSNLDFYRSRFTRISIPYLVSLAIVIPVSVITGLLFGQWLTLSATIEYFFVHESAESGAVFATLTNCLLFLQDWVMFLQQNGEGGLIFTSNFWNSHPQLWHFLWIPQAWSVGLELTFYISAPFIVRKLSFKSLATVAGMSLLVRLISYHQLGAAHDPWTYRFFPFELAHFCYGILGCRLMQYWQPFFTRITIRNAQFETIMGLWYYPIITAATLGGLWIHCRLSALGEYHAGVLFRGGGELFYLASLSIWILLVPILFSCTRDNRFDRAVGELSYPVYLLHYTIVLCVSGFIAKIGWHGSSLGEISTVFTILVAVVLQVLVLDRFEARRQAITMRQTNNALHTEPRSQTV